MRIIRHRTGDDRPIVDNFVVATLQEKPHILGSGDGQLLLGTWIFQTSHHHLPSLLPINTLFSPNLRVMLIFLCEKRFKQGLI